MRLISSLLLAGVLAFALPVPSRADDQSDFLGPAGRAALAQGLDKAAQQLQALTQTTLEEVTRKPTVNCGLTLVPPDPKLDAKIRVPMAKGPAGATGVTPMIRRVTPPICRPARTFGPVLPPLPRR